MDHMRWIATATCIASVLAAGCGGASEPVPDVLGERLDVAKSEMDAAGYDTEEIGGGTFGVLNESNWTVCETRPEAGATDAGTVKLIIDRSCGDTAASKDESSSESDASSTPEPTSTPKPKRKRKPAAQAPAAARISVPNVVGMDHQAAQNRMQAAGLYNLRERDATGQGRFLLYDRNWVVVEQRPAPGSSANEMTKVTLFSVKDGEQ